MGQLELQLDSLCRRSFRCSTIFWDRSKDWLGKYGLDAHSQSKESPAMYGDTYPRLVKEGNQCVQSIKSNGHKERPGFACGGKLEEYKVKTSQKGGCDDNHDGLGNAGEAKALSQHRHYIESLGSQG